jgi:hypothetical protein
MFNNRIIAMRNQKNDGALKRVKLRAKKEAAFTLLREAGVGPSQAAEVLGHRAAHGSHLEKKRNAYEISRDSLLTKSVQALKAFTSGERIGGDLVRDPATGEPVFDPDTGKPMYKGGVLPKGSDVMRAAEAVLDREAPKVNLNVSISKEFIAIDLNDYR